jgi:acyl-coenzyme A thioesterase PaaI-like protein
MAQFGPRHAATAKTCLAFQCTPRGEMAEQPPRTHDLAARARQDLRMSLDVPREVLDGHLFGAGQPCFGCSPDHPIGFRLVFEREEAGGDPRGARIVTRFTPADRYQGPPGIMHGGLVSTLADEVAAWALIGLRQKFGFTVSFDAKLRKAIRVGVPLVGRSWIAKDQRRLLDVGVEIEQGGELGYAGTLRFVLLDKAGAERMLGRTLPPTWERFCR